MWFFQINFHGRFCLLPSSHTGQFDQESHEWLCCMYCMAFGLGKRQWWMRSPHKHLELTVKRGSKYQGVFPCWLTFQSKTINMFVDPSCEPFTDVHVLIRTSQNVESTVDVWYCRHWYWSTYQVAKKWPCVTCPHIRLNTRARIGHRRFPAVQCCAHARDEHKFHGENRKKVGQFQVVTGIPPATRGYAIYGFFL